MDVIIKTSDREDKKFDVIIDGKNLVLKVWVIIQYIAMMTENIDIF